MKPQLGKQVIAGGVKTRWIVVGRGRNSRMIEVKTSIINRTGPSATLLPPIPLSQLAPTWRKFFMLIRGGAITDWGLEIRHFQQTKPKGV